MPTTEERHAQLREHYRQLIEHHEAEGRDDAWAPTAEESIAADIASIEELGVSDAAVQCATTTCRVDLTWPDYELAKDSFNKLLHKHYDANCGREIYLPPPDDTSAAYAATAMFNCEAGRIEGS